jgi:hypothetical protein
MELDIVDIDNQLRTNSALWSALHSHGRERRQEKEMLDGINDLLDLRLELMQHEKLPQVPEQPSHAG